jgi:hypothetical protein
MFADANPGCSERQQVVFCFFKDNFGQYGWASRKIPDATGHRSTDFHEQKQSGAVDHTGKKCVLPEKDHLLRLKCTELISRHGHLSRLPRKS